MSNENENLTVSSEKTISVEGHEGVLFDGKMVQFDAGQDVEISSILVMQLYLMYYLWIAYRMGHVPGEIRSMYITALFQSQ